MWDDRDDVFEVRPYTRGGVVHMTGLTYHMRSLYYSDWVALLALVVVVFMPPISAVAEDIRLRQRQT